eukprot:CAMPEP_0119536344 /NCGR_PEP_ID=MMETSP1344-20130328/49197_1 /TAXON_ID=236787 /ORGANISM="Florenciella parvula, Strain CCMP2471" /LENGTH=60 /DNA_ID=CAMNT_0007578347 /DNA_START=199 /DNA_END=381 /DNA_ORIENTATION=+
MATNTAMDRWSQPNSQAKHMVNMIMFPLMNKKSNLKSRNIISGDRLEIMFNHIGTAASVK